MQIEELVEIKEKYNPATFWLEQSSFSSLLSQLSRVFGPNVLTFIEGPGKLRVLGMSVRLIV